MVSALPFWAGRSITRTERISWLQRAAVVGVAGAGIVALLEWLGRPLVELAT